MLWIENSGWSPIGHIALIALAKLAAKEDASWEMERYIG
jgi:hypothetical protein